MFHIVNESIGNGQSGKNTIMQWAFWSDTLINQQKDTTNTATIFFLKKKDI